MIFTFVILHYNAFEDTKACVHSIKQYVGLSSPIIIVDNNSPNGSGKELENFYTSDSQVHVLLNQENLGFARGNNVGFLYAKQNFKPDFIVLLNNDTLILQHEFTNIVEQEFAKSQFAVLGPTIQTPHKPYNSNPGPTKLPSIHFFKKYLRKVQIKLFLNYLHLDNLYEKVIHTFSKEKQKQEISERRENVLLHGSFLIFSKLYFSKFDGLNDKTFLYQEERLLFLRLKQNNMKSVFLPDLKIFHKEDVSTNTVSSKNYLKRRFRYKHYIRSVRVLINAMQKGNA